MVGELQRGADEPAVPRSAVLAARLGDRRRWRQVDRSDRGHAAHRRPERRALQLGDVLRRVPARGAGQREHGRQGDLLPVAAGSRRRTRSSAATTASPTRSPPTTIRAAADSASSRRPRSSGTASSIRCSNNVGSSTLIRYNPILNPTQGSNFRTHSLFFNDQWRVNRSLTLNLGHALRPQRRRQLRRGRRTSRTPR